MLEHKEGLKMSCSVCAGHSSYNCPCCSEEVRMIPCPDCDAKGVVYHAFHIGERKFKKVTELAYTILPPDEDDARFMRGKWCQGGIEVCPTCRGEGEIPEDY